MCKTRTSEIVFGANAIAALFPVAGKFFFISADIVCQCPWATNGAIGANFISKSPPLNSIFFFFLFSCFFPPASHTRLSFQHVQHLIELYFQNQLDPSAAGNVFLRLFLDDPAIVSPSALAETPAPPLQAPLLALLKRLWKILAKNDAESPLVEMMYPLLPPRLLDDEAHLLCVLNKMLRC
jgi:hypothetical protein